MIMIKLCTMLCVFLVESFNLTFILYENCDFSFDSLCAAVAVVCTTTQVSLIEFEMET